jgi:FkbM family methyltransferase
MDHPFVSYAQNGEDVVLWRALNSVSAGRYVEVGANHPSIDSISKAFYDRGWSGVAIEPVPALAETFRVTRPRDVVVQAAITSADDDEVVLHVIEDTGLSTLVDHIGNEHARAGLPVTDVHVPARRLDSVLDEYVRDDEDIHFLVVDTEGTEKSVLESVNLVRWRPWVLVIEATAPRSDRPTHEDWEDLVLSAGYQFCMFDGLSRWYVAKERSDFASSLGYPACSLDSWVSNRTHQAETQLAKLEPERNLLADQLVMWRGMVMDRWATAASAAVVNPGAGGVTSHESARLRKELEDIQRTLSWRVTAPLRQVRTMQLRRSRRA